MLTKVLGFTAGLSAILGLYALEVATRPTPPAPSVRVIPMQVLDDPVGDHLREVGKQKLKEAFAKAATDACPPRCAHLP